MTHEDIKKRLSDKFFVGSGSLSVEEYLELEDLLLAEVERAREEVTDEILETVRVNIHMVNCMADWRVLDKDIRKTLRSKSLTPKA